MSILSLFLPCLHVAALNDGQLRAKVGQCDGLWAISLDTLRAPRARQDMLGLPGGSSVANKSPVIVISWIFVGLIHGNN